jgi:hypothetical protein
MTQNEKIMNALQKGTKLSAALAKSRYGVRNLRARISELRNERNLNIETDFKVKRDGTVSAIYRLVTN